MTTVLSYTNVNGDLQRYIKLALENLNWSFQEQENGIKVNFGNNLKHWGAKMNIIYTDDYSEIKFITKFPVQLIDGGYGERKIKTLILEIEKEANKDYFSRL